MLIVEDVHWADRPSVDLMAYLVRLAGRLAGAAGPELAPGALRTAARLHAAVTEAGESGRAHTVEPRLLNAGEVAEVLSAAGVPQPDVPRMLSETRGLPMLVREYAEALRAAGQDGGEDWTPPDSVRGLLGRRLRSAGEPATQMLSTAAVLGSGCDADLLRAVSGRGEAETVEALDEAVARFLLIEVPPAGGTGAPCYDFPYEALRRVAYESASLARRRLLHGRAAGALAARYERDPLSVRAAVIAGHLQRAGRETEAAGRWWRAAARARELYAHAEAHAHLRQALALGYPHVPGSSRRVTCSPCSAGTGRPLPRTRPPPLAAMATTPPRPPSSTSSPRCITGWGTGRWRTRTWRRPLTCSQPGISAAGPAPVPTGRWSPTGSVRTSGRRSSAGRR